MKQVILEPSTNTHVMEAEQGITAMDLGSGILKLKVNGNGITTHGEHGTITTEKSTVIKYVQQELNPITKLMQNAFD